jgi:hypothetical protein
LSNNLLNNPARNNTASPLSLAVREFVAAMPIVMLFTAVIAALKSRPVSSVRGATSRQFSTR